VYAGLKYLGDSLISAYYIRNGNELTMEMNGDPTVLSDEFLQQPLFTFLKQIKEPVQICNGNFKTTPFGRGWAWDDYNDWYMAERSNMPVYENLFHFFLKNDSLISVPKIPNQFITFSQSLSKPFFIKRNVDENKFQVLPSEKMDSDFYIPIKTNDKRINNFQLLLDTLDNNFINPLQIDNCSAFESKINNRIPIYSQPVDSVFIPMMHRSDNFFAEQTLLMVSNERLGYMDESKMIDSLLKNDFATIPQMPKWVDGSGLSRYNLFTPQSFVYILDKLKNDFGFERMKKILPTGGQGSLKNYYINDKGFIYAKTGSHSNQLSLSGYLIAKNNKLYIFSILLNNYMGDSKAARKSIERFIESVRKL
jgi:D-alanyl-D-alanine carboxypeptidase/D-alanyl-D-alanine-endopeptidase (penicillin-binding protein 4)